MVCGEELEPLTPEFGENIRIAVGTSEMIWVSGTIDMDDGANKAVTSKETMAQRIRSGFFDLRHGTIRIQSNPTVSVIYYDENMNIIPNISSAHDTEWDSADALSGAVYVRLIAKATSPDAGQSVTVTFTES